MSTAHLNIETFLGARAGRRSATGVGRVIAYILAAAERQRTRRDLASLDERMLKDIGLSRYEVEMELRRPWWHA